MDDNTRVCNMIRIIFVSCRRYSLDDLIAHLNTYNTVKWESYQFILSPCVYICLKYTLKVQWCIIPTYLLINVLLSVLHVSLRLMNPFISSSILTVLLEHPRLTASFISKARLIITDGVCSRHCFLHGASYGKLFLIRAQNQFSKLL